MSETKDSIATDDAVVAENGDIRQPHDHYVCNLPHDIERGHDHYCMPEAEGCDEYTCFGVLSDGERDIRDVLGDDRANVVDALIDENGEILF